MKILEIIIHAIVNTVLDNFYIFLGVMAALFLIIIVCWKG